jgi:rfaE bifunctional protein kinase chain/domain
MTIEQTVEHDRLTAIVRQFPQHRILICGDLVADQFLYGSITRVSREAPVLILRYEKTETTPGGAANCAVNVAALDAQPIIVGAIGTDAAGDALVESLKQAGVECEQILRIPGFRTTTKVRVLAGQLHSTRQQILRIDYEGESTIDDEARHEVVDRVREQLKNVGAVIISDYNYGLVDSTVSDAIRVAAAERRIPVAVDSRRRITDFKGFTSATPNEEEVVQAIGHEFDSVEMLKESGERLRQELGYVSLLITRGSHGMLLLQEGEPPLEIATVGAREPVDVTGAGDTVIATYTLALASGASFADAARLANHAGGIVVMKRGTAAVSRQEVLSSVLRWGERT